MIPKKNVLNLKFELELAMLVADRISDEIDAVKGRLVTSSDFTEEVVSHLNYLYGYLSNVNATICRTKDELIVKNESEVKDAE